MAPCFAAAQTAPIINIAKCNLEEPFVFECHGSSVQQWGIALRGPHDQGR